MNTNVRTGDKKVLSYGDNLLRKSDVDLLGGPYWLNDQVVLTLWYRPACLCKATHIAEQELGAAYMRAHADHHVLL